MKLELKHLAGYLPYGLKVFRENKSVPSDTFVIKGATKENVFLSENGLVVVDIDRIKPILRPLSDLTKEIEVNGEKFVPLEMLLKEHLTIQIRGFKSAPKYEIIKCEHNSFKYSNPISNEYSITYLEPINNGFSYVRKLIYDDTFYRFILRNVSPEEKFVGMSYRELDELLLEWHFDIYGLIEKGLGIDINILGK